jgi:hypothetical protein
VQIMYRDDVRGTAVESTLMLYRLEGSNWVRVAGGSVDSVANTVTAAVAEPGTYAVLGETSPVFLPIIATR